MEFQKPQRQVVKTQGAETTISLNGGPFQKIPASSPAPGASNDLFFHQFISQFNLDIDFANKPSESNLHKVLVYQKKEDGSPEDAEFVVNFKTAEFIYDRSQGLITQMNLTGASPMPPIEIRQVYEEKNGRKVPKSVLTRTITSAGAIVSVVKLTNEKVEKQ